MSGHQAEIVDYEVTEEGVFYQEAPPDEEAEESDPLATDSEPSDSGDKQAREELFGASVDDLLEEARRTRSRRKRRKRRRSTAIASSSKRSRNAEIPAHLQSVMGSATIAFMMHRFDEAERSLQRVIQEAPKAASPHRTLGLIYEERGEKAKALEAFMTAAELDKQDGELWKRNASVWAELGDTSKAVYCLSHAVRATRASDGDALKARGMLYMQLRKFKMAADSFIKLSKLEPNNVDVARLISLAFKEANNDERAVAPIEEMLRACEFQVPKTNDPDVVIEYEVTLADLMQILIEARFRQQKYYEASLFLPRLQNRSSITGRPMTFVQRLMVAICQHRLGSATLASPTFLEFMSSPSMISKYSFFLWEVGEACRDSGDYRKAIRAYSLLCDVGNGEKNVQLLLNRAACFKDMGNLPGAQTDLEAALSLEPRNVEAALRIVEFLPPGYYWRGGKATKAGRWSHYGTGQRGLAREERLGAINRLRVANAIYENGNYKSYLAEIHPPLEAALNLGAFSKSRRASKCSESEDIEGEAHEVISNVTDTGNAVTVSAEVDGSAENDREYWTGKHLPDREQAKLHRIGSAMMRVLDNVIFLEVAERLVMSFWQEGNMALSQPVTRLFDSLSHLRIRNNPAMRFRLRMLDVAASFAAGDVCHCYDYARAMLLEKPSDSDSCYVFSIAEQLLSAATDPYRNRSCRYLNRLVKKNPDSVFLLMVVANCSIRGAMNTSTYTVGFYLRAFKLFPHHPLICLCVAVQILYLAMSRRVANRNEVVLHAFAFLDEYRRNRVGKESGLKGKMLQMEAEYNIGRAMHQMGLVDMAVEMYNRVLQTDTHEDGGIPAWGDVRRDAAYNLIQIYRNTGARELASALAAEHLTF